MDLPGHDAAAGEAAHSKLRAAMLKHQQGELYAADLLYAQALQLEPANRKALRLRGILARERGEIDLSRQLLEQAIEVEPDNPEPRGELALTYMASGALEDAEQTLRATLATTRAANNIQANLGALLQHRGHIKEAIDCYRAVLDADRGDIEVRCNLAKSLADSGRQEEALRECSIAVELSGNHPHALATLGAVLIDGRQFAAARRTLEESVSLDSTDDMAFVNLALVNYELGDVAVARDVLLQAVSTNPWNARAVADLANCFCALDDTNAALDLCESFLRQHPGERLVIAAYALALHNAGSAEAAAELTDCGKLVRIFELSCPETFADMESFNAALSERIRHDSSLTDNPVSKSTFGGAQTGELKLGEDGCLAALGSLLSESILEAVESYKRAGLSGHPLMSPAATDWTIRAWGTVLETGGKQTSHMHPLGWLSGVYYAGVPDDMNTESAEEGWLEFGRPPERFFRATEPAATRYQPRPGRLVLFPSWFWHQTIPFESADPRISIAFDVMSKSMLRML